MRMEKKLICSIIEKQIGNMTEGQTVLRMKDAAIYCRYSSDLQKDTSIEDQARLCTHFADTAGYKVVAEYHDRARSGASIFGRDGIIDLLADAKRKRFRAVIVEALDRLSRDQEDLAGIFKRLSFAGIQLIAVHDGEADPVQIGVRGLLGSLYLQDLAHKIRRGMTGRVAAGKSPGGKAYGYKSIPGKPGELEIVEPEAEIIRRIYRDFAQGKAIRTISDELNAEGVEPPRGQFWRASTLIGNKARGYGLLSTELYHGQLVWNRVHMVRDPETGKRVIRENPKSEWQYKDVPHLRIVEDEIWNAAQARQEKAARGKRQTGFVRKRRLLSGLIKCGVCASPMVVDGNDRSGKARIICSRAKETKQCSHSRRYYLDTVEDTVLSAFSKILHSKENLELFIGAYVAERKRLAQEAIANRARLEANLRSAQDDRRRLVELYCKGHVDETYIEQEMPIKNLAIEQAQGALDVAPPIDRVALNEEAIHAYRAIVTALAENIHTKDLSEPLMQRFREFIGPVIVKPTEARAPLAIELYGIMGSFVNGSVP